MSYRCLTNNPMVYNQDLSFVEVVKGTPLDLFIVIKEEIAKGFRLITHPLTSSLAPNTSPYKTVFLSSGAATEIHMESLQIIEKAIAYTEDLMKNHPLPNWDDASRKDFQLVDLDLIKHLL
ncbi:GrdX family protein [Clostridiaceae bacterium 35-E11]